MERENFFTMDKETKTIIYVIQELSLLLDGKIVMRSGDRIIGWVHVSSATSELSKKAKKKRWIQEGEYKFFVPSLKEVQDKVGSKLEKTNLAYEFKKLYQEIFDNIDVLINKINS